MNGDSVGRRDPLSLDVEITPELESWLSKSSPIKVPTIGGGPTEAPIRVRPIGSGINGGSLPTSGTPTYPVAGGASPAPGSSADVPPTTSPPVSPTTPVSGPLSTPVRLDPTNPGSTPIDIAKPPPPPTISFPLVGPVSLPTIARGAGTLLAGGATAAGTPTTSPYEPPPVGGVPTPGRLPPEEKPVGPTIGVGIGIELGPGGSGVIKIFGIPIIPLWGR